MICTLELTNYWAFIQLTNESVKHFSESLRTHIETLVSKVF